MTKAAGAYDLIVLGGGPGGSSLATFVAMQGHRVLLLERESFPRHQIGESLLPATVHGICPLLGVSEPIATAGFPRKRGGTFRWGKNPDPWTFTFAKRANDPRGYAYQVERSKFDAILLDNARAKGVEVRERHAVSELLMEGGRVVGVRFTDANGAQHVARAPFTADCGGHKGNHYSLVGERVFSKFFQNVALYAYFEGGKRLPPPNSGNILCCAFGAGWFWYIPLSDTLTSVGAVVARDAAESMKQGHEAAFDGFIKACPLIAEYLANAKRVTEGPYGEYRVRKDYSYCNTKFWGDGFLLVGDAACFIDPVFSSGVHLSTYSALLAARSINTRLKGESTDELVFGEYEQRYRREFGNFYQFLVAFYDMHQDEGSYFWEARKIIRTEERANDAFVRLVAGLSSMDEPLFSGASFFEAREGFGEWFQETIPVGDGTLAPGKPRELRNGEFDARKFMDGFTDEIARVQLQATFGEDRPAELPQTARRLVPTADGFHWRGI
jgi:FAD-dependent halogenase